jgi:hypothetical protein
MTVLTEGIHTEEFLLVEGPGTISREQATVDNGADLEPGTVVKMVGGKLVQATGAYDSDGVSTEDIVGVLCAKALAASAEVPGQAYIARIAEVKEDLVVFHSGAADADKKAAVVAALKALNIIVR